MAITETSHILPLRGTLYGKRLYNSPKLRMLDKVLRHHFTNYF
jgi:hypothetical protein